MTENNKIIAEFLGKEYKDNSIVIDYTQLSGVNPSGKVWQETKYHKDWNWLMEVVEKIETHGFNFEIKKNWARISKKGENIVLRWEQDKSKLDAVYNACLEFIKWYNEQKKV